MHRGVRETLVKNKTIKQSPALLSGYHRKKVNGKSYPVIIPGTGVVQGLMYSNLDDKDMAVLDDYEGDEYERVPVKALLPDNVEIDCYVYKEKRGFVEVSHEDWEYSEFTSKMNVGPEDLNLAKFSLN